MKTILVPTDYSPTADNAIEYAADLARYTDSKIILLHVYHLPVITTEVPSQVLYDIEDIEKENNKRLEKVKNEILLKYPGTIIQTCLKIGFSGEEIINVAEEKKLDMIVMGIQGASAVKEFIVGSTTSSVVRKAHCPVMVIPDEVKFNAPDYIVFACDYGEDFTNKNMWSKVKGFINMFKSKMYLLNVLKAEELIHMHKVATGLEIDNYLENISYSVHFLQGNNLIDRINDFINQKKAKMLIMLPKRYTFFERLFHKSSTKKMIFHAHVPVLTLHAE